jgi:uncharacterized DUF497 family protein
MRSNDPLIGCTGFDWDESNVGKNWERHHVTPEEAEAIFFHDPFLCRTDPGHSRGEKRYMALGRTDRERWLFAAFTVRRKLIRIISVRDMNQRESEEYRRHEEADS